MSHIEPPTPNTQDDEPLFAGYEPPTPEPTPDLSAGQRLTIRQSRDIAVGRHPLTGGPLHPLASQHRDADSPKADPFTCGSCYFRNTAPYHDRSYPKCFLPGPRTGQTYKVGNVTMTHGYPRVTHGAASDVRAWWPACTDYSPGETGSPDAARGIPEVTD